MPLTESELIASSKSGDERAFDLLVKGNLPKIKGSLFTRFNVSREDMEDIIQNSLIKAWRRIQSFQGNSSFSTWLYTIFKNVAIDHLRDQQKCRAREVHGLIEMMEDDLDLVPSALIDEKLSSTAQTIIEKRESIETYSRLINSVLDGLTPDHREIIQLALRDERSYKEISQILNIPCGTVMSRLYFARRNAKVLATNYANAS
jgi:RNA polymerase sigma-70 factor (ECF subfamily)